MSLRPASLSGDHHQRPGPWGFKLKEETPGQGMMRTGAGEWKGQAKRCRKRERGSPWGWGCLPLTGVRAPGDRLPWILRGCEDPSAEGITAEGQRVSPPIFYLTAIPGAQPVSPGIFMYHHPPATPSYRLPLLSCQAPEASLSLKTLGEKNHEKLQEREVPTQPLPPPHGPAALCPHSRQRWGGVAADGPQSVPSKVTIGGGPRRATLSEV